MKSTPLSPYHEAITPSPDGVTPLFGNAAAYEQFMSRWSAEAGKMFLDWLAAPAGKRWLEIGCGTGTLTRLIAEHSQPHSLVGIDPESAAISVARDKAISSGPAYLLADARALPFSDGIFDVVASGLVLNFIPETLRALAEMMRVAGRPAIIAAYVWDFANELSPSGPLRRGMRGFGIEPPAIPGADRSALPNLQLCFRRSGLEAIRATKFEISVAMPDFHSFWEAQTTSHGTTTGIIARMPIEQRAALRQHIRARLPGGGNGPIRYFARANAIQGRVG